MFEGALVPSCSMCSGPITGESETSEHVIPEAICGRLKVKGFICRRSNNDSGSARSVVTTASPRAASHDCSRLCKCVACTATERRQLNINQRAPLGCTCASGQHAFFWNSPVTCLALARSGVVRGASGMTQNESNGMPYANASQPADRAARSARSLRDCRTPGQ